MPMTEADYAAERDSTTPLMRALASAVNSVSAENGSNTPDFILGRYLCACLQNFDRVTIKGNPRVIEETPIARAIGSVLAAHHDALPAGAFTESMAVYLADCLTTFDAAVNRREEWYGRNPKMGPAGMLTDDGPVDVNPPLAHHPV